MVIVAELGRLAGHNMSIIAQEVARSGGLQTNPWLLYLDLNLHFYNLSLCQKLLIASLLDAPRVYWCIAAVSIRLDSLMACWFQPDATRHEQALQTRIHMTE